jgi:hypothetical protein
MIRTSSSRRLKTAVLRVVLLSGSLLFALVLAEFGIRLVAPQTLALNYTEWDPDTGFKNRPNANGFFNSAEFTMEVRINATGQRDREFPRAKRAGIYRIVVLGDSFTFGHGVAANETYVKRLEGNLRETLHRPVESINMGIGKSGTAHELALWRKNVRYYESDLVLVGFCLGNDFIDNMVGVFRLEKGELVHQTTSYSSIRRMQTVAQAVPFYSWLAQNSHLVNLLRSQLTQLDDRTRKREAGSKDRNTASPAAASEDLGYEISYVELTTLAKEVTDSGRSFGVVFIPDLSALIRAENSRPDDYDRMAKRFREAIRASGLKSLDLVPTFLRLRREQPDKRWYYEMDLHWTVDAHRVAADEIARWVTAEFIR